jgi:uncharacterized protein
MGGAARPTARAAPAAALLAALLLLPAPAGAREVPALTGPVVDEAGLLSRADVRRLEGLARAARGAGGGTGPQLQFLVVRSLDGQPIDDFSIRVAEAWKLGTAERDDGVLLTVAAEERAVRIEVGGGLEGGLTDVQDSRIIRTVIAPAFREGRYGDGLYDAGVQVLSALGALPSGVAQRHAARPSPASRFGGLGFMGLFIAFIVLRSVLFGLSGRRRRSLWWFGGPWMGGGGGWGGGGGGWGGGGGGWSGGGGGFSGGGASGRW